MTKDDIVVRLRSANRAEVSRRTHIKYHYLRKLLRGEIENPGHKQIDTLREYFISEDVRQK